MKVAIIGAGAAGCFCAVNIKRKYPDAVVEVFEGGKRAMAKLAITGGGRCNLTNSFAAIGNLADAYPRGSHLMKRMLSVFDHNDTMEWFEHEGVRLVTQDDNCVFPVSQDAMQIVNTLLVLMRRLDVKLHLDHKITDIKSLRQDFDRVVVTTGGSTKRSGLSFLDSLDLDIIAPVPSLFSFNIHSNITELMGTVVENVEVKLAGTKFKANDSLLITHWGMSGPAILKLSSYAARYLADNQYHASLLVNWLGMNEESAQQMLRSMIAHNPQKQISTIHPESLSSRFWQYLLERCDIPAERRMNELSKKHINVLAATLINDTYQIEGKNRFKDEFVTCGGVALSNIDLRTLEAKKHPGIYFAGEVLDVDAITGGFNLQAAWSMAWVVSIMEVAK